MAIIVNLDVMMAKRKISLNELSEKVDLTLSNLSILKTGKAKAIRFSTLEAICKARYQSLYNNKYKPARQHNRGDPNDLPGRCYGWFYNRDHE